eukprot:6325473-Pyramimonas_sp.AAC.1
MTDGHVLTFNKYEHHILEAPQDIISALGDFLELYRECSVLVLGLEGVHADSGGLLECQALLEPRFEEYARASSQRYLKAWRSWLLDGIDKG